MSHTYTGSWPQPKAFIPEVHHSDMYVSFLSHLALGLVTVLMMPSPPGNGPMICSMRDKGSSSSPLHPVIATMATELEGMQTACRPATLAKPCTLVECSQEFNYRTSTHSDVISLWPFLSFMPFKWCFTRPMTFISSSPGTSHLRCLVTRSLESRITRIPLFETMIHMASSPSSKYPP